MTIAVFNFRNSTVDMITVDSEYINTMHSRDVESYLVKDLAYDADDICFMSDVRSINFVDSDTINQII